MKNSFPRIITLLRKERGLSQKQAAAELSISQALLSHYEKGIRECGLDFLIKIADFYNVSCDYILGRTPDRTPIRNAIPEFHETAPSGEPDNLLVYNKKLIINSLEIILDLTARCQNITLSNNISLFIMAGIYRAFRILYATNQKNPASTFSIEPELYRALSASLMKISEAMAVCTASGHKIKGVDPLSADRQLTLSPDRLLKYYPDYASSLLTLIDTVEREIASNLKREYNT